MSEQLSHRISTKVISTVAAGASGSSDMNSDGVDTTGYDGVRFIVPFGPITSGAITAVRVQQSDDDGSADAYGDLAGAASLAVGDTRDEDIVIVEIWRPQKKWLRVYVDRGTQVATVYPIIAERYNMRTLGEADDSATVISRTILTSPAEA